MSDPKQSNSSGSKDSLDQVVREARTDAPDVNWSRVDEALFARVAKERTQQASLVRFRGSRTWGALAGLAAAAAAVVLLGHGQDRPAARGFGSGAMTDSVQTAAKDEGGSTFTAKQGAGEVLVGVGGAIAPIAGHPQLGVGTVVETQDARALWDARSPTGEARATWLLEEDSRVAVKGIAPLVLGLERGAVEAQVVPVANGEAFAVDVGDERIAVHGTHLRISREGDRVTVDLSEGVVSIGRPPRTGSTYGTLVVAPAHVRFDLVDVLGSIQVTHDADAVRPVTSFTAVAESAAAARAVRAAPQGGAVPSAPARGLGGSPGGASPGGGIRSGGASRGSPAGTAGVVAVDPQAEQTIAAAVRTCAADAPHSTEVTVTVSSSLELTVGEDGFVRAARFNPPLAPEIQKCASTSIYKTRFADPGVRSVDIVLLR
jgi:hypothetical protein